MIDFLYKIKVRKRILLRMIYLNLLKDVKEIIIIYKKYENFIQMNHISKQEGFGCYILNLGYWWE